MKVAIYCRLSEEDRNKQFETDDSNSIQNQKAMLLQYAMEQGWELYNIYSDDDYTGADRRRPEFNRLLVDAEAKRFDIILCKTQSRFTRELELVEKYIHGLFPIWGIRFVSIVDNADTEDGNPRLFKYNLESGQLAIVGGAINNVFESHNFYKVAVDAQNTPFVVYRDYKGLKNSFVINLDNETKQWSDAFALNTASSERAFVDFNSNNDGFIGVLMEEGNVIELYTYADAD